MKSFFYDARLRSIFFQAVTVGVVGALVWWLVDNTVTNLVRTNARTGFEFLRSRVGFEIGETLIAYSSDSSYGRALIVGLLNTARVAVAGIVTATFLGALIGLGRLSSNWLVSRLCYVYVEVFRNTPALLVIFFWYLGVLALLPPPAGSIQLPFGALLNNRGFAYPAIVWHPGSAVIAWSLALSVAGSIALWLWGSRHRARTGQSLPVGWCMLALVAALTGGAFAFAGHTVGLDFPVASRFNLVGGSVLSPEFMALFLALSFYTAAFIAEIVRAGIQGVPRGQTEAAAALGLDRFSVTRLVTIPQALRIVIPPLTSQYLNLTKNSSLAVAIGYPELVSVGGTIMNQSGHILEIVSIWFLVYLAVSLSTSALMNWFNTRFALVER